MALLLHQLHLSCLAQRINVTLPLNVVLEFSPDKVLRFSQRTWLNRKPSKEQPAKEPGQLFGGLPEELTEKILRLLDQRQDIVNVSLVSRQLQRIIEKQLWASVKFNLKSRTWFNAFIFFRIKTDLGLNVGKLDLGHTQLSKFSSSSIKPRNLERVFPNVEYLLVGLPQVDLFSSLHNKIHSLTLRFSNANFSSRTSMAPARGPAARNLILGSSLKSLQIQNGALLNEIKVDYWAEELIELLQLRTVPLQSLTFSACDGVGSRVMQEIGFENLCYQAYQKANSDHGGNYCAFSCVRELYLSPQTRRLAIWSKYCHDHTEHNWFIQERLQGLSPLRNPHLKELTIPEAILSKNTLTAFLPHRLEELQIQYVSPERDPWAAAMMKHRRKVAMKGFAKSKQRTLPSLKRIIWWFQEQNGSHLPDDLRQSLTCFEAIFADIGT